MTYLPPKNLIFFTKLYNKWYDSPLKCYEKVNGMFADINCGNEMFWGHLGVQKRGLKKGKLTQKIIAFSKKTKNTALHTVTMV